MNRVLVHASELLTGAGIRAKDGRKVVDVDLGVIPDGALVCEGKKIAWVGPSAELPKKYRGYQTQDLKLQKTVVPGWIDCHTHMIFAGDRSEEFAQRCAGATYEEIAQRGGGILSTIRPTRAATLDELVELGLDRVREAQRFGVTTLEIKSGYGLSAEAELKSLEAIAEIRRRVPEMSFQSTFLGAHAFPPEGDADKYVTDLVEKMLPAVAEKKLAEACDVFIDRGYYSVDQARVILTRAQELGLAIKVHGDELVNTESASFAVEMGALSVDHLLQVSDQGILDLAGSDTVAVLLPGTAFYIRAAYAPARKLIDAGACVALSTDLNPGSSMINSLPVIMTMAGLYMGMSRAEILAGVTYNAAKALGFHQETGTLEVGKRADYTIVPFKKFEEVYYRFAWTPT